MTCRRLLPWVLAIAFGAGSARAVILLGTGDNLANTTPPGGALANSGWISQTDSGPSANAISPHRLLTGAHIGIQVNANVRFDGLTYKVQRVTTAPGTDLQMLEIAGRMDSNRLAEIYTDSDEAGKAAVIHGHGRMRGEGVFRDSAGGPVLRGWKWTGSDSRLRWGTNTIDSTPTYGTASFLVAIFSGTAGRDEATVSLGDSGGGIFIRAADGRWKLAALNYDVEGYFRQTSNSPAFFAALFDRRGFYSLNPFGVWVKLPDSGIQPGTLWQASRVSTQKAWINQQLAIPPLATWPRLLSATSPTGPYQEHSAYAVDPETRRVTFKANEQRRFFQLGAQTGIVSIREADGLVEVQY